MKKLAAVLLIAAFILLPMSSKAELNRGSRSRKRLIIGGVEFFTNYWYLPIVPNEWTFISKADAIKAVKQLPHSDTIKKSTFAIIQAEAAQDRVSGKYKGLNNNYGGVQTDSGVWGTPNFDAQTARIDSGGVPRMFAVFNTFKDFAEFVANRLKNKGFEAATSPESWTNLYITKWWGGANTAANQAAKKAIYNTAMRLYNASR